MKGGFMFTKKLIIGLTFLLFTIALSSYDIELTGDVLEITGEPGELIKSTLSVGLGRFTTLEMEDMQQGSKLGDPDLPHYTKVIALPDNGNWEINKLTYDVKGIDIEYPIVPSGWEDLTEWNDSRADQWLPSEIVTISDPSIMRDYRFSQVSVATVQYNAALQKIRLITNLDLQLSVDYTNNANPHSGRELPGSDAFTKLAQQWIFGVDNFRNDNDYAGSLLIISRSSAQSYLETLADWKRKMGYRTYTATTVETGSSSNSIKNYIQNAYDNWTYPPDHVLLVGDVSGSYSVPAFYCEGYMYPNDVTDHDYALLDGTDYFPDVLLGRISVQSSSQLTTTISKIINYESNPYMSNTSWFTKGLMMSVVEDGWGSEYFSGRETVINAKEKLLDFTYTQVDTFIAPDQSSHTTLRNMINTGYTFLNYRGFGSAYYWTGAYGGHMFDIGDINSLSNGRMLPMVTSIVCGGGDFADNNYTTCFGETWLVSGSATNPRGAIAFIGPSEHDTKTPFNNCNDLGIYQGITEEGIFSTSGMLLRGKMEMYNNFPTCHSWGGATNSDQFYFYVYNLLGDPTVEIWTDVPKSCELELASEIPVGQNYLEISLSSEDDQIEGFRVSVTSDDGLLATGITNNNGNAYIPLEMPIGDYTVTASRYGYIPAVEEIEVIAADALGIMDYSTDITPTAGNDFELELMLHNYAGSNAFGITVELLNYDGYLDLLTSSSNLDLLASGNDAMLSFDLNANDQWVDGRYGQIFCNVSSSLGNSTSMIELEIQSPEIAFSNYDVDNSSGFLEQSILCPLYIELYNGGSAATGTINAVLFSLDSNAVVTASESSYNSISPGNSAENVALFELLPANVITGQVANLQLTLYDGVSLVQTIPVTISIGEINQESPTYDSYGYMAIESQDSGDFDAPVYEWLDISPYSGGEGTYLTSPHMHETDDGWIDQLDLPFDFQYYGESFDRITVCQNGYFSFGNTQTMFFRNKAIPSGYGPDGLVCPFWDDLSEGYVYHWYDEDNHRFMIEWKNMRLEYNDNHRQFFQVILRDPEYYPTTTGDGEILFIYQQVNNYDQAENYASVGIESPDKTQGLQITFANLYPDTAHNLADETAILFTPVESASGGIMYGDVDANGLVEAFDASIALQYFVGIDPGAVAPLPWEEWRVTRSDVDGNGTVEAYDGSLILQYFVGIIDEFPVEQGRKLNLRK
jgi:Peptidase family C25/Propeptide_C25